MLLDDYCNINTTTSNSSLTWDSATKWTNVVKFILKVPNTETPQFYHCHLFDLGESFVYGHDQGLPVEFKRNGLRVHLQRGHYGRRVLLHFQPAA